MINSQRKGHRVNITMYIHLCGWRFELCGDAKKNNLIERKGQ